MKQEHYHFIGIGGIGMSALARILLKQKMIVTGSDIARNSMIDGLIKEGASVHIGHSEKHVMPGIKVIYSSIISESNPEITEAKKLQCELLHRSQLLSCLTRGYKTLAVTGSHGKTSTSSLLTSVLKKSGLDPAFALGGIAQDFQSNGDGGEGGYFVLEADESDGSFLNYEVQGAIVTNIDNDHLDHYGTQGNLKAAFKEFIDKVKDPSLLFCCGDDPSLVEVSPRAFHYGFGLECDLRVSQFEQKGWRSYFDIEFEGKRYPKIELALLGRHQVLNASAVFGLCLKMGLEEEAIRNALKTFKGVARRCEVKGESEKLLVLDDYAHHPTEIRATIKGVREAINKKRLVVVFQPHRYTRTENCLNDYASVFDQADLLFVTDIYGAGEKPIPGVTAEGVVKTIQAHSLVKVDYVQREALLDKLLKNLQPHDVVLMLSAGDLPKLGEELAKQMKLTL